MEYLPLLTELARLHSVVPLSTLALVLHRLLGDGSARPTGGSDAPEDAKSAPRPAVSPGRGGEAAGGARGEADEVLSKRRWRKVFKATRLAYDIGTCGVVEDATREFVRWERHLESMSDKVPPSAASTESARAQYVKMLQTLSSGKEAAASHSAGASVDHSNAVAVLTGFEGAWAHVRASLSPAMADVESVLETRGEMDTGGHSLLHILRHATEEALASAMESVFRPGNPKDGVDVVRSAAECLSTMKAPLVRSFSPPPPTWSFMSVAMPVVAGVAFGGAGGAVKFAAREAREARGAREGHEPSAGSGQPLAPRRPPQRVRSSRGSRRHLRTRGDAAAADEGDGNGDGSGGGGTAAEKPVRPPHTFLPTYLSDDEQNPPRTAAQVKEIVEYHRNLELHREALADGAAEGGAVDATDSLAQRPPAPPEELVAVSDEEDDFIIDGYVKEMESEDEDHESSSDSDPDNDELTAEDKKRRRAAAVHNAAIVERDIGGDARGGKFMREGAVGDVGKLRKAAPKHKRTTRFRWLGVREMELQRHEFLRRRARARLARRKRRAHRWALMHPADSFKLLYKAIATYATVEHVVDRYCMLLCLSLMRLALADLFKLRARYASALSDAHEIASHLVGRALPLFERSLSFDPANEGRDLLALTFRLARRPHHAILRRILIKMKMFGAALAGIDVVLFPKTVKAHSDGIKALAFAHTNSDVILTGAHDGLIKLWNVRTGTQLGQFAGHTSCVTYATFTKDDERIISCSFDATIKVFNTAAAKCVMTLTGHTDSILDADLANDDDTLVTASMDGSCRTWSVATGACYRIFHGHGADTWVKSVKFCNSGTEFASVGLDRRVVVWKLASDATVPFRAWITHDDHVVDIAVYSQYIVTASKDRTLRIWDYLRSSKPGNRELSIPLSSWAVTIDVSPDDSMIAAATFDNAILVFNAGKGTLERQIRIQSTGTTKLRFRDNKELIVGTSDGKLQIVKL